MVMRRTATSTPALTPLGKGACVPATSIAEPSAGVNRMRSDSAD
jgi:hypothetical protein